MLGVVRVLSQRTAGRVMQYREDIVSLHSSVPNSGDLEDSRMWYVRLKIRDDRLAKLWAWNLAEHDVIVWSESEERWKQLLAVPELRAAVRSATTSAYVRHKAASEPPPAAGLSRSSIVELSIQEVEEPTRVRWSSAPVPASLDPMLHALTTSIPPAVHTNPAPAIPRAPRLPSFANAAEAQPNLTPSWTRGVGQRDLFRSRWWRVVRRGISRVPAKNLGWGMLPVLGAAVFALVLFRSPEGAVSSSPAGTPVTQGSLAEWVLDEQQLAERLAAKLVGAAPVCAGQAPAVAELPILSPEQLEPVVSTNDTKRGASSSWRAGTSTSSTAVARRKALDAGQAGSSAAKASSASAAANAGNDEFDRDAARTALRFAMARAKNCSNSGVSGAVLVTFASNGTAQRVQLSQLVGDDVDPGCVTRAFSGSRIPPFTGSAVTVRKSF